jgi:hypothetical protein
MTLKLCKNCVYMTKGRWTFGGIHRAVERNTELCTRKQDIELVNGSPINIQPCSLERSAWFFGCGRKGKYYQGRAIMDGDK